MKMTVLVQLGLAIIIIMINTDVSFLATVNYHFVLIVLGNHVCCQQTQIIDLILLQLADHSNK